MADLEERDPISGAAADTAARHQLTGLISRSAPLMAWNRLDAMKGWLTRARLAAGKAEPQASSAAEWLLDNDYQIQRAILQIREDLPQEFYAKLPGLGEGGLARPRIHQLAHSLLQASHLQVSLNTAVHYVDRYQEQMPLSIAEIWAFPTMLRIVCLELLVTAFSRLFPDVEPPFQIVETPDACAAAFDDTEYVARAIANLAVIATIQWNDFFDRTSRVEAILRRDPAGVYPRMDFDTRDRYRHADFGLSTTGTAAPRPIGALADDLHALVAVALDRRLGEARALVVLGRRRGGGRDWSGSLGPSWRLVGGVDRGA